MVLADHKYEVDVKTVTKKLDRDMIDEELERLHLVDDRGKPILAGITPQMLRDMIQEYVECPVLNEDVTFVRCYVCPNFLNRVTGKVLCKGGSVNLSEAE